MNTSEPKGKLSEQDRMKLMIGAGFGERPATKADLAEAYRVVLARHAQRLTAHNLTFGEKVRTTGRGPNVRAEFAGTAETKPAA